MREQVIGKIYFIGIGGIGMSAIARYMLAQGAEVYGYDKTRTRLTRKLEDEGMKIHYTDDVDLVPTDVGMVVYTPAIPSSHRGLQYCREYGYKLVKRAELLGLLSKEKYTIAIAGTHGKTSTSSAVSHILTDSKREVSAFVGGIMKNYASNYIQGSSSWIVVEADEYDRSFLWLSPNISVVMSMDADHLDIYGAHDDMVQSFNEFIQQTVVGGVVILAADLKPMLTEVTHLVLHENAVRVITFGEETGDVQIRNVRVVDGCFWFDLMGADSELKDLQCNMPGRHNVQNATAAILASLEQGAGVEEIQKGLSTFAGIKRRFEKVYSDHTVTYIDDYAHHPTELKAAIGAAQELYTGRRILGIFQPHLYSRTKDFAEDFGKALSELDEVILLDIYPAREQPIEGVSSQLIYDAIEHERKTLATKETLMEIVKEITKEKENDIEVIMTLGAGDIDVLVPEIGSWLENREK